MRRLRTTALTTTATALLLAAAPAAHAEQIVGVTGEVGGRQAVVTFDSAAPNARSLRAVTGLQANERIASLDVRPADGQVLALGVTPGPDAGADDASGRILTLNVATGAATALGAAFSAALDDDASFGMEVNPVTDTIRVVNDSGQNIRVRATDGGLVGVDTATNVTGIGSIAHDRSNAGATATTLFGVSATTDTLATIGGPNGAPSPDGGVVVTIGALGIDFASTGGFDISAFSSIAFLSATETGGATGLYAVNTATGATTLLAATSTSIDAITVLPVSTMQVLAPAVSVEESTGVADVTVTRIGDTRLPATVDYATAPGTASVDTDFRAISGSLAFHAGVTSRTVRIPITVDTTYEANEAFTLTLSNATGGAGLGTAPTATITVTEPTPKPVEPPKPDTTGPVVMLPAYGPQTVGTLTNPGLVVSFSCDEACRGNFVFRSGTTVVGVGSLRLRKPGVGRVFLKLTARGQTIVARQIAAAKFKRAPVSLTLIARDTAYNATTIRRVFSAF